MRIFISCQSPLLQKSLSNFLLKYKTEEQNICDFIISDKEIEEFKSIFLISNKKNANLSMPFLKDELILKLEEFFKNISKKEIQNELTYALKEIKKEQNQKIKNLAKKIS